MLTAMSGPAIAGATVIHGLTIASVWGRWPVVIEVGSIAVLLHAFNAWASLRGLPLLGLPRNEVLRQGVNLSAITVIGVLAGWSLPVWMWLPFAAVLLDPRHGRLYGWTLALHAAMVGVALLTGGDPRLALIVVSISATCHALTVTRIRLIRDLLDERERQNQLLAQARTTLQAVHERALGQEKLSSLGMLAAGVAHEINNPMAFVTSNVRSLLLDLEALASDSQLRQEYRTEILPATLDGIERINAIVGDLRRFARGEPDTMVEYSVDEQVQSAARIARTRFAPGVLLTVYLDGPAVALGRPGQLVQVLVNLLVNASQAVGGEGTVSVTTGHDDEMLWIQVRDTGMGMDMETRARLFEPFFTTKPAGEGTGLGLAVAHGIIQAHGGEISVETAPGRGTSFTVRLPLRPPEQLEQPLRVTSETRRVA